MELDPGFLAIHGDDSVVAVVNIDGIDPQSETASLHVELSVPSKLLATLGSSASSAQLVVTALASQGGGSPEAVFNSSLSPRDFGDPQVEAIPTTEVNITAAPLASSRPTDFPLDSYELDLRIQIFLPEGERFGLGQETISELPIDAYVEQSDTLADFTTSALIDSRPFSSAATGWNSLFDRNRATTAAINLTFTRSTSEWLLTFAAAAMPLLLIALFVALLRANAIDAELDFLIGIAASLLAILPLRATLIPAAIQSRTLTLLDLFLALQAGTLCPGCMRTYAEMANAVS